MIRKTMLLLCSALVLAGVSAQAAEVRGSKAQIPLIGSDEASKSVTTITPGPQVGGPGGALMAPLGGKALTADEIINGMKAVKQGADGKQQTIEVPERVQKMLRAKKAMAPVRAPKGKLKQVKDTRVYPYSSFGVLSNGCSAVTVLKKYALTPAYCLYDTEKKAFEQKLAYFPALNGDQAPVQQAAVVNMFVAEEFMKKNDMRFGVGLVELDRDVGDETGWAGFGEIEGSNSAKSMAFVGYPLKGVKTVGTMWESNCEIQGTDDSFLVYACAAKTEQLAAMPGAVLYLMNKADEGAYVQGIHAVPANKENTQWGAVRLTGPMAQIILSWAGIQTEGDGGDEEETDNEDTGGDDEQETTDCNCEDQGGGDQGGGDDTGGDEEEDEGGDIGEKPKSN